ncbi:hypothetical protein ACHAW6_000136 [Cyclotella cf. meneghiniana]
MTVGTVHKQPAKDTCVYEVHFTDGHTEELAANTIAEALYAQCNPDENQSLCLTPSWITGRVSMWPSLGMIRSRSLTARRLSHAPHAVGSCVVNGRMAVHLGRNCPTSRSLTLLRLLSSNLLWTLPMNQPSTGGCHGSSRRKMATGTSFWRNAIELEMKMCMLPLMFSWMVLRPHQIISLACSRGHMTKAPATLVSRETVCITMLVEVLNDIEIWTTDVLNTYITMPCHEKIWTTLGKEFSDDCSWKGTIV